MVNSTKVLVYAIYTAIILAITSVFVMAIVHEYKYDTLQELRPCPFCGNTDIEEDRIIKYFDDGTLMCDLTVVECDNCGAEILTSLKYGEPHAKELWNKRK